jgi:predicted Zn-dependent protease
MPTVPRPGLRWARSTRRSDATTKRRPRSPLPASSIRRSRAYVNAADAFRAAGKEAAARDTLKDGIAMMPDSAVLHHSLGLSYARQQQSADALRELERAVALAPDQSQYVYVYAVGLNSFGRTQDAIRTLERAAQRWPRQRDVQLALATMYRDAGRRDAARNVAKRYADAFPDDTEVQALVRSLN